MVRNQPQHQRYRISTVDQDIGVSVPYSLSDLLTSSPDPASSFPFATGSSFGTARPKSPGRSGDETHVHGLYNEPQAAFLPSILF